MIARKSRARRGVTLVELMAALASLTIVLGLAVALITMLLKLSESGRDHLTDEIRLARVARLFRRDVRGASERIGAPTTNAFQSLILLDPEDVTIEYSVERGDLRRIERADKLVLSDERLRLPMSSRPRFELFDDRGTPMLRLSLDRKKKSPAPGVTRLLQIEAALGATRRFEQIRRHGK